MLFLVQDRRRRSQHNPCGFLPCPQHCNCGDVSAGLRIEGGWIHNVVVIRANPLISGELRLSGKFLESAVVGAGGEIAVIIIAATWSVFHDKYRQGVEESNPFSCSAWLGGMKGTSSSTCSCCKVGGVWGRELLYFPTWSCLTLA